MTDIKNSLLLIDFYPVRGMSKPGELVRLMLDCEAADACTQDFTLTIYHGLDHVETRRETRSLDAGRNQIDFSWLPPVNAPAGYGAEVRCEDPAIAPRKLVTAFDVLPNWTIFPRYGYLTDFSTARPNEKNTLQSLSKFHINGLQFYDWQFRHDQLVAPIEEYLDPLGRPLSLAVIKRLIKVAHEYGMAAMPYLAVYAASVAFWRAHPDWILYDAEHNPIPFGEDFLGIMNPQSGGPWQTYLLDECDRILNELPFDGLHIDQYGEPKSGYDQTGQPVDIASAFGDFVQAAANRHSRNPILFNAVGNWPIEILAAAPVSFNYIEIWPPDTQYSDLARVVRNARMLSNEKPVVIALYIPADREINHLLADAMIISAGGTRTLIGENNRLLTDPYFPKHEAISDHLMPKLRACADFTVRYEEWIGPLIPESAALEIKMPRGVQFFYRKVKAGASLSLVNLNGVDPLCWNEQHPRPDVIGPFVLEIPLEFHPTKIWLLDPYSAEEPKPLLFDHKGEKVEVFIPELEIWKVLLFVS